MKQLNLSIPIVAAIFFALLTACQPDNCPPNAFAATGIHIVNQNGNAVAYTDTLSVIGMTRSKAASGEDVWIKDTLINKQTETKTLSIPLSYGNFTDFILQWYGKPADTLHIEQRNIPYYMSNECGTMMFHEIVTLRSTTYMLDSVKVINAQIDNNEKENIRIYVKVDSNN